jgi:membrane protein YqaA with SNARE-associated domain
MDWHYILVFLGAFLFDVVPFPFPPAFSIMVPLQILFDLNPWWVIIIGVAGSILGRFVLTLYIPFLADKIFKHDKNKDVEFLGSKLKEKGWKSQAVIVAYSLLPLPTTPLFLAGGMAKIKPLYIIPAFFVGKFTSDALAVHFGNYAADNFDSIVHTALSWKSITSLSLGVLLLFALLFIDWRSLIQQKKLQLKFKIWK